VTARLQDGISASGRLLSLAPAPKDDVAGAKPNVKYVGVIREQNRKFNKLNS
jgi:hypothetical protein